MKLVVLGLSLSSSWGNGHATTYRALLSAFAERGHEILFLERDAPWYSANRDCPSPSYCRLHYYSSLEELRRFDDELRAADAIMVGSFVAEGVAVGRHVQSVATGLKVFYDIDTPVTLAKLDRGDEEYLSAGQIAAYDIYFSFTGGPTLRRLEQEFGSPLARELYCSVDTGRYRPLDVPQRWDLSYLGTYSPDRQPKLDELLIEVARRCPEKRFCVAGPQYPQELIWPENVDRIEHLPPAEHPEFYSASRFTLNVTRADMVATGWAPSVRLFEAAACGTPIISDGWAGIESVLRAPEEIVLADSAEHVIAALANHNAKAAGMAARRRVLAEHSAERRAAQLEKDLIARKGGAANLQERLEHANQ